MTTTDAITTERINYPTISTTGKDRREVNAMALFDFRQSGRKRASGPLSGLDKAQRIELARAKLHYQDDVRAQLTALYALRSIR